MQAAFFIARHSMNALLFQKRLLDWFDEHGRKDLPWQQPATPYRVWVSEIMLQQTQVVTVIPYFQRFMQRFPDVETLATAPVDEVLQLWAGLGYYARARNLHKAAQAIVKRGSFPDTVETLNELPGVGLSTAGAISSIAFNKSAPILDGNVRRVLARFHAISGWTGERKINQELWRFSRLYTPVDRVADYTQAVMDLGATLCTRNKPRCQDCPLNQSCLALKENKVSELPTPKPKKTQPVKTRVFLLLQDSNQQILLQKRPPTGIWGGLWSLPEFDSIKTAQDWCLQHNIGIQEQQSLESGRHTFSHYHLDYTPLWMLCDNPINIVMEQSRSVWYKASQLETLALPAPVTRLLQAHFGETT